MLEVTEYDKILESLLKERIAIRDDVSVRQLHPERSGEEVLAAEIELRTSLESEQRRVGHLQIIQGGGRVRQIAVYGTIQAAASARCCEGQNEMGHD